MWNFCKTDLLYFPKNIGGWNIDILELLFEAGKRTEMSPGVFRIAGFCNGGVVPSVSAATELGSITHYKCRGA